MDLIKHMLIEHSGIAIKYYLYIQAMDLEVNANP